MGFLDNLFSNSNVKVSSSLLQVVQQEDHDGNEARDEGYNGIYCPESHLVEFGLEADFTRPNPGCA
jgi:hypothetical protein